MREREEGDLPGQNELRSRPCQQKWQAWQTEASKQDVMKPAYAGNSAERNRQGAEKQIGLFSLSAWQI